MTALQQYIMDKREAGEKLLSIYLTAGYPALEATPRLLDAVVAGGADLIELGVPFSDPLADGRTIQAASQAALAAGATLPYAIATANAFAGKSAPPLLLMGYVNPFLQYGWPRLVRDAHVAGYIVPDLPPEESGELARQAAAAGQSLVFLVSPNTGDARIAHIDRLASGFIYAVSLTGVTGARDRVPEGTVDFLRRLRHRSSHPVLVGFGISNAATAKRLGALCDGVIVGSAVINLIAESADIDAACDRVAAFVQGIKQALREG